MSAAADWFQTSVVRAAIEAAARFSNDVEPYDRCGVRSGCAIWEGRGVIESPIEAVFLAWWYALRPLYPHPQLVIVPQVDVHAGGSHYRLDFIISPPALKIAVETDGHAFHERTREQVDYRNRRDRALQSSGWRVFHFSGRELLTNPAGCVVNVVNVAIQEARVSRAL